MGKNAVWLKYEEEKQKDRTKAQKMSQEQKEKTITDGLRSNKLRL